MPPVWGRLVISVAAALRMRHEPLATAHRSADLNDMNAAVDLTLDAVRAAPPDSRALPGLVAALDEALRPDMRTAGRPVTSALRSAHFARPPRDAGFSDREQGDFAVGAGQPRWGAG